MKKIVSISLVTTLALTGLEAATNAELEKRVAKLEKKLLKTNIKLNKVKAHDAFDNIKFGVDFRNAVDVINYKNNKTGTKTSNDSLLSSRLFLTMKAAPMNGLIFSGRLAIYSTWGSNLYVEDAPLKDWSSSSKAADTVMRVKEVYFVYSTEIGEQPISFSIGRRPSSNGFLANYRENEPKPGSPSAHITNMEVNAIMTKLGYSRFIEGAYSKFVYGRAHTGKMENVYGTGTTPWRGPYANDDTSEDDNVDFFVLVGNAYNDGQYQIMYQWAHIFNTKGLNIAKNQADKTKGKKEIGRAHV